MRGKITSALVALLAMGAGLGVGGASLNAQAEPLKIRGAWVAPLANLASVWLQKKDLAVHFGQSYTFEPVRYAGTPPIAAMTKPVRARNIVTPRLRQSSPAMASS